MRAFAVFALAVAPAFASVISQTVTSGSVTATATVDIGLFGPFAIESFNSPSGSIVVSIPDVVAPPGATIELDLSMNGAPTDSVIDWEWFATGYYKTTAGDSFYLDPRSDVAPDISIAYDGPGAISLTWAPFIPVSEVPGGGGGTITTVTASATLGLTAAMTLDPVDTPEPATFGVIPLGYCLFCLARRYRKPYRPMP